MNIATIDFDIIMKPSINFYNDLVNNADNISTIIDDFTFLTNIPAELFIYDYLTQYILKCLRHTNNIYFIKSHEEAVRIIYKENQQNSEEINLYNIDHHHDIFYDDDEVILTAANYDCGNWVKYCMDSNTVSNYYWIHNDNSTYPSEKNYNKYVTEDYELSDFNLEDLSEKTDVLIICFSPEWIPPTYKPLFYTWMNICEELTGKNFNIDLF